MHGWDYITDSGVIKDEQGHGTAVAGIIAAEGNNSLGVTCVMWRASLMSLRVLDSTGTGDVADAVEAIDYAVTNGAQVINLSWGTADESGLREPPYPVLLMYARLVGVLTDILIDDRLNLPSR